MIKETDFQEIRARHSSLNYHMIEDMELFNHKYGFDKVRKQDITREFLQFRMRFIIEEVQEMCKAHNENNSEDFVDSIIDMIVVGIGTLQFMGVDVRKAWNEVHMSNMTKQRNVNPKRAGSGGIDLIKPDSWVAPDHSDNIGLLPEIFEENLGNIYVFESDEDEEDIGNPKPEDEFQFHEMVMYTSDQENDINPKSDAMERKLYEIREMMKDFTYIDHTVMVLLECIELRIRKGRDYNAGGIQLADYFLFGIDSIFNEIHKKYLRAKSILSKLREGQSEEFEGIEDTFMDIIVYSSFAVAYMRGVCPGQTNSGDMFGRKIRSLS